MVQKQKKNVHQKQIYSDYVKLHGFMTTFYAILKTGGVPTNYS